MQILAESYVIELGVRHAPHTISKYISTSYERVLSTMIEQFFLQRTTLCSRGVPGESWWGRISPEGEICGFLYVENPLIIPGF